MDICLQRSSLFLQTITIWCFALHTNQRLMQWSLIEQSFNLDLQHKKGTEIVVADSLLQWHFNKSCELQDPS